jgi:endonuclease/exonuclease/phosphatase family metal-dependent hydrolase
MTFNVLHDRVWTLAPSWGARHRVVAEAIRSARPDVACLQEVSLRQLDDLSLNLAEYRVFAGTLSGGTTFTGWARPGAFFGRLFLGDFFKRGAHCPILVRRGFGAPNNSGSFLLTRDSPTPHVVNWVRIRLPSATLVDVFSTHLGFVRGRTNGIPVGLLRLLDDHWSGTQILAGDFNALPSGPLLRSLTGMGTLRGRAFQDVWTVARSGARGGTFHWGLGLPGPRLDYVLVRPPCAIDSVRTVGARVGRVLPSDHYAVVADLRIGDPGGH